MRPQGQVLQLPDRARRRLLRSPTSRPSTSSRPRTASCSATSTIRMVRQRDIAGILNKDRNVLGMMPHPERAADALMGSTDGLVILQSLAGALAARERMSAITRRRHRDSSAHTGRVRQDLSASGPRAHLHGTRHLQRHVERALLLQELAPAPEEAADAERARAGRAPARTRASSISARAGPSRSRSNRTTTRASSSRSRAPRPVSAEFCATSSPWARGR